ncbi:KH domain-containing protein [Dorcoceras hygrometricum]|uniref:KH domain-containing protein n=1 Tax=Dorcoceras hygrometricum TaxID=472368 RepID=A0A2Z7CF34_9LAMI|nr:KH domain-containing protein [Dorcoceras hygrometricum]
MQIVTALYISLFTGVSGYGLVGYCIPLPARKIGSISGSGGEIVKQLRLDTRYKIRIGESVSGCEDRIVTIYSTSEETNVSDSIDGHVGPAQDALIKVHDRIVADGTAVDENLEEALLVTARLLVSSDQIGCIIRKGGQIVQNIRSESGAQSHILKDDHLPTCALSSDELVQRPLSGYLAIVLFLVEEPRSLEIMKQLEKLCDNGQCSPDILVGGVVIYGKSSWEKDTANISSALSCNILQ